MADKLPDIFDTDTVPTVRIVVDAHSTSHSSTPQSVNLITCSDEHNSITSTNTTPYHIPVSHHQHRASWDASHLLIDREKDISCQMCKIADEYDHRKTTQTSSSLPSSGIFDVLCRRFSLLSYQAPQQHSHLDMTDSGHPDTIMNEHDTTMTMMQSSQMNPQLTSSSSISPTTNKHPMECEHVAHDNDEGYEVHSLSMIETLAMGTQYQDDVFEFSFVYDE